MFFVYKKINESGKEEEASINIDNISHTYMDCARVCMNNAVVLTLEEDAAARLKAIINKSPYNVEGEV